MNKVRHDESTLQPRLNFPDYRGGFHKEYIPRTYKESTKKVLMLYTELRRRLGLNFYYWHVRNLFPPLDRKIKDLEFLHHVIEQHEGRPSIFMERLHFRYAWWLYGQEYRYILGREQDEEIFKESTKDVYYQKHPYVIAYRKRWLNHAKDDSEWTTLYHGLRLRDMEFFINAVEKRAIERNKLHDRIFRNKEL